MSSPMQRRTLALVACLACVCHGGSVQDPVAQAESSRSHQALVKALFAFNPGSAFATKCLRACHVNCNPNMASASPVFLKRTVGLAMMQESFDSLVGALWDEKDASRAQQILEAGNVDLAARLNGKTALHYAALDGHTHLVREIVSKGAFIDAVDEQQGTEGMTALMWAAMNGHEEVCKVLVQLGADTSIREKGGMTAAELAEAYDHDAVVAVFK